MRNPNLCGSEPEPTQCSAPSGPLRWWERVPVATLGLSLLFLAFLLVPRVQGNPRLIWTFSGVAAFLFAWTLVLWIGAKSWGQSFRIERVPLVKSHYIQASVQLCFYAYWGWYWRDVYDEIPLILSQLVFIYAFDALVSWSRGRSWRLGCGPLPIILSTNVFMWFKPDWYVFQFVLVAAAVLGKEYIKWNRDGRRTHIFNPSGFALALVSLVLIVSATTEYTYAGRIADSFDKPPHIYLVIFGLGLIVQYFFSVTLMTLSAVAALCVFGLLYTWSTGTYNFVFSNIPAPVFLGLHLLVTDPSTSPRTNTGKMIFGALYGLGVFMLYALLSQIGVPTVFDKLLPIPILNLSVQWIDRVARKGIIGAYARWESAFQPRRANLVHMGCWMVLFFAMIRTGFVDAPHEGSTYQFWKNALDEGRPNAARGLLEVVKSQARGGNAAAWNELGVMYLEGKVVKRDVPTAVRYFAQACKLGNVAGSANLAHQYLSSDGTSSGKIVAQALDQLEEECGKGTDGAVYYLMGLAYETGKGRPIDRSRAHELYRQGCTRGNNDACAGLGRIPLKDGAGAATTK